METRHSRAGRRLGLVLLVPIAGGLVWLSLGGVLRPRARLQPPANELFLPLLEDEVELEPLLREGSASVGASRSAFEEPAPTERTPEVRAQFPLHGRVVDSFGLPVFPCALNVAHGDVGDHLDTRFGGARSRSFWPWTNRSRTFEDSGGAMEAVSVAPDGTFRLEAVAAGSAAILARPVRYDGWQLQGSTTASRNVRFDVPSTEDAGELRLVVPADNLLEVVVSGFERTGREVEESTFVLERAFALGQRLRWIPIQDGPLPKSGHLLFRDLMEKPHRLRIRSGDRQLGMGEGFVEPRSGAHIRLWLDVGLPGDEELAVRAVTSLPPPLTSRVGPPGARAKATPRAFRVVKRVGASPARPAEDE